MTHGFEQQKEASAVTYLSHHSTSIQLELEVLENHQENVTIHTCNFESAAVNIADVARQQDNKTTREQDNKTTRQQRQQDNKTTRQ